MSIFDTATVCGRLCTLTDFASVAFYKDKQKRRTGSETDWIKCIKISPAEELGICEYMLACALT